MNNSSADFYARLAPYYDQLFGCDAAIVSFLEQHGATRGAVVLDIACGSGACTRELLRRGVDVYGIDLSAELISDARGRAEDIGGAEIPGLADRFTLGDMLEVEHHPVAPFDLAYCIGNSMSHLPAVADIDRFVAALSRSLRPDGAAIIQYVSTDTMAVGDSRDLPDLIAAGVRFRRTYRRVSAESVVFDAILEIRGSHDHNLLQQRLLVIERDALLETLGRHRFIEPRLFGGFTDTPPTAESWVEVVVAREGR